MCNVAFTTFITKMARENKQKCVLFTAICFELSIVDPSSKVKIKELFFSVTCLIFQQARQKHTQTFLSISECGTMGNCRMT